MSICHALAALICSGDGSSDYRVSSRGTAGGSFSTFIIQRRDASHIRTNSRRIESAPSGICRRFPSNGEPRTAYRCSHHFLAPSRCSGLDIEPEQIFHLLAPQASPRNHRPF
eukprot:Pompholyxophrys_punicea_v1_NODE_188_length_2887_cov_6.109463.p5 type:complete len:112 gc:universal NODE_188_length_2887_cov_6.109463:1846-1511(-)